MLKIIDGGSVTPLDFDRYYILEAYDGRDSLGFTLPLEHPQYPLIAEETPLMDAESGQRYLVKAIDEGAKTVNVKAELDLDELRADLRMDYTNNSDTAAGTIGAVLPAGWSVRDHAHLSIRRTVELEAGTPLEIIEACTSPFGITCRYDNAARAVHIWQPEQLQAAGVYLTDELNLREVNFKGSSKDFATRLYARGKDGLTFAAINGGKDYVDDHTYSDKVVATYWKDERYTVAENLLADAKRSLAALAVPQRSYECSVLDLARAREEDSGANANIYAHLGLEIYTVCTLLDRRRGQRIDHQVVQLKRWPHYPEDNVVTLSTAAPKIQNTVKSIQAQIEKPTSSFRQQMQAVLDNLADTIAGYNGGNLVMTQNGDGKPNGLRIMDTEDVATAKKVLWLNLNGIAYSQNGVNGPYSTVWSFEQNGFVADWIVAGTITANLIKAGTLRSLNDVTSLNMETGTLTIGDNVFKADLSKGGLAFYISDQKAGIVTTENAEYGNECAAEFGRLYLHLPNGGRESVLNVGYQGGYGHVPALSAGIFSVGYGGSSRIFAYYENGKSYVDVDELYVNGHKIT